MYRKPTKKESQIHLFINFLLKVSAFSLLENFPTACVFKYTGTLEQVQLYNTMKTAVFAQLLEVFELFTISALLTLKRLHLGSVT